MAMMPIGRVIRLQAEDDPERVAVTYEDRAITRMELELRSNRLARAYQQLGVTQDDFVTIALPNGIEFYEATVATWKLGATPQPVSARLPFLERDAIVDVVGELSEEELLAHLGERLVRYKVPRSFELVNEPLRDDAGKVRRSALREERLQSIPDRLDDGSPSVQRHLEDSIRGNRELGRRLAE